MQQSGTYENRQDAVACYNVQWRCQLYDECSTSSSPWTLDKCRICWMQSLVYTVHNFCQFSLQTHFNLLLQGLVVDVIKLGKPRKWMVTMVLKETGKSLQTNWCCWDVRCCLQNPRDLSSFDFWSSVCALLHHPHFVTSSLKLVSPNCKTICVGFPTSFTHLFCPSLYTDWAATHLRTNSASLSHQLSFWKKYICCFCKPASAHEKVYGE